MYRNGVLCLLSFAGFPKMLSKECENMQYSEGKIGRAFVLRLEEGDRLPDTLETFARNKEIEGAMVLYLGGAADGSRVVVEPELNCGDQIVPIVHGLAGSQEILALGTLFRNEENLPILHMHAGIGREGNATIGCTRAGVPVWLVAEAVILEILGTGALRKKNPQNGLELLQMQG